MQARASRFLGKKCRHSFSKNSYTYGIFRPHTLSATCFSVSDIGRLMRNFGDHHKNFRPFTTPPPPPDITWLHYKIIYFLYRRNASRLVMISLWSCQICNTIPLVYFLSPLSEAVLFLLWSTDITLLPLMLCW